METILESQPDRDSSPEVLTDTEGVAGETIGTLLIKEGFLTRDQLTYAQRVRSKLSTPKTLFSVLKELEFVTENQLREALSANPGILRLGPAGRTGRVAEDTTRGRFGSSIR